VTPLANPLTSPASGLVEFWGEYGSYDIFVHDTIVPARIADKTFGWEATSGADRGLPSVKIAGDGNLLYATKDAASKRQDVPLGTVLDWWRPSSTYDAGGGAGVAPPGYAVCDGATVLQADHDFGAIGSIVLPDLRNKFVLGASLAIADGGVSATPADAAASAPGIRGVGGSHLHLHSVPAHYHSAQGTGATIAATTATESVGHTHTGTTGNDTPDHTHTIATYQDNSARSLGETVSMGDYNASGGAASTNGASARHQHPFTTGGVSASHTHSIPHANITGLVGTVTAGQNGDAAFNTVNGDTRPSYVGLLKIMKIKRS
jgi:hypothetical protein